jgi:NDP-sugar pyrophosphorylase family protein
MNGRVSAVPSIARERALRAVVLRGGSIRPTPFRTAINRSIMDMPIEEGVRLMLYWQQQVVDLARAYDLDQLPTRVQVNRGSPLPAAAKAIDGCAVSIERDRGEYRGTGGILRDLAEEYDDDDFILVANGGQILTHSLVEMLHQLHEVEADVSFVAHQDGAPSGLMLVRCEALRMISARGYVDMKEQALPAIARRFKVTHIEQRRATGLPLHSLQDYLAAVRWWHRHGAAQAHLGLDAIHSAEARVRESKTSFSIVESGATVDPTAHLHDCVVLRGAKVAEGAVVARSVLCAGSSLEANETAVDELLYAGGPSARRRRILQVA